MRDQFVICKTQYLNMHIILYRSTGKICKTTFEMSSKTKKELENERKKPKLPRVTVSLDEFDEKIISKLVGFEGQNKSEVIRSILKKWIGENSSKIQSVYGIMFEDVRREIQLDQDVKEIEAKIEKLPIFFKRIQRIEIDRLAGQLDLNSQTLINLILENGDQLEKKGLNLIIDGEHIIKK